MKLSLLYKPPVYLDEEGEEEDDRPIVPFEDLDPATQAEVLRTRRFIKLVGWVSIGSIGLMIILTIVLVVLKSAS